MSTLAFDTSGKKLPVFEYQTCSRCRGSGRHSFCERFRDICFKCRGRTVTLTKRGEAAARYFDELRTKIGIDLKPGDHILVSSVTFGGTPFEYVAEVTDVRMIESKGYYARTENGKVIKTEWTHRLQITTRHKKFGESRLSTSEDSKHVVYNYDREAKLEQALEYQATLTKTGKPRMVRKGKV